MLKIVKFFTCVYASSLSDFLQNFSHPVGTIFVPPTESLSKFWLENRWNSLSNYIWAKCKDKVSAWQSATLLPISCKSVLPVPARVEEPVSPVKHGKVGCQNCQFAIRHRRRTRTTTKCKRDLFLSWINELLCYLRAIFYLDGRTNESQNVKKLDIVQYYRTERSYQTITAICNC